MATFVNKFGIYVKKLNSLYDSHPFTMNTMFGGAVYIAGELVVSATDKCNDGKSLKYILSNDIEWKRVSEIGVLGCIENGVFMLTWYNFLNRVVGSNIYTHTVLIKCLFDQIFFASQADLSFLALCAYQNKAQLPLAIEEIKKSFLTTWINDCSIWPFINFIGFSVVPVNLQPTYMSTVQFFWQVYMSSVANRSNNHITDDHLLEMIFFGMDTNNNGYITGYELYQALLLRGVKVHVHEVINMINDVHVHNNNDDINNSNRVSLEEFKWLARGLSKIENDLNNNFQTSKNVSYHDSDTSKLWLKIIHSRDLSLEKGAKAIIKRLDHLDDIKRYKQVIENNDEINQQWHEDRNNALYRMKIGTSLLIALALTRKMIFKI